MLVVDRRQGVGDGGVEDDGVGGRGRGTVGVHQRVGGRAVDHHLARLHRTPARGHGLRYHVVRQRRARGRLARGRLVGPRPRVRIAGPRLGRLLLTHEPFEQAHARRQLEVLCSKAQASFVIRGTFKMVFLTHLIMSIVHLATLFD